jgi:ATP-dependent Lon protease
VAHHSASKLGQYATPHHLALQLQIGYYGQDRAMDAMSEEFLPLFPLNVVLFPGAHLPLHIFEERYKTLIRECIRDDAEFGINLAQDQEISAVGCTARVVEVAHSYDDGRLDIVVEGGRRYRVVREGPKNQPYAIGIITEILSSSDEVDPELSRRTRELYNQLITVVYKGSMRELTPEDGRRHLSFVMAQKAGLDLADRQRLLEQDSENDRLQTLFTYLNNIVPRLSRLDEIERIISSDGYIQ